MVTSVTNCFLFIFYNGLQWLPKKQSDGNRNRTLETFFVKAYKSLFLKDSFFFTLFLKGWYGDNVLLSESSEITPENFTDKFIVRLAKYRLEDYNEEGHSRNTGDADWRKQTKQMEIFIIKYG